MKNINELININLKELYSAEDHQMYYSDFLDINGEKMYNDVLSKLFAEQLEERGLVTIYRELCILTEKGSLIAVGGGWLKHLDSQKIQKQNDLEKENFEFEKSKVDLSLNKWQLKTRWFPHIIAFISLVVIFYIYFDSKYNANELEKKVSLLESKISKLENANPK